jgi:hypothetical protein
MHELCNGRWEFAQVAATNAAGTRNEQTRSRQNGSTGSRTKSICAHRNDDFMALLADAAKRSIRVHQVQRVERAVHPLSGKQQEQR